MRDSRSHRRWPVSMRPLVVILLSVCFGLAGSAVHPSRVYSQPTTQASFTRTAAAAIAHGKRSEAEQLARSRGSSDPDAIAVLAQLAIERGQYDEAKAQLEPAAARDATGEAALELALLYKMLGRSGDAEPILTGILKQGAGAADAAALFRAARAAHALNRARDANSLYRDAERAGGDPAAIETAWGRLFLEKYNQPEALKSFQAALQADSSWAPAHVGLARLFQDDDAGAAAASANRAIEIDPQSVEPHLLLASLHLDADHEDQARDELNKALAINPSSLEAHAILGAMAYVRDDRAGFDEQVAKVLAINPSYGEVYRIAAEQAASHYRFEEAAALAQQGLGLDPNNTRASGDLGMHLMRTGDEAGARRSLEKAFRGDPFDKVTYNLLSLLDTLDQFVTVRDGDFMFRMQRDEAPVLREYAVPLAKDALHTLSGRYGFTPSGPILVEIFPQHDDFAVRNLGLPGMIGALGACFGRVVTMDSPHARPPGTFSWEATLWHELTHVITLQMSKQRIPRWLTEGISVYEEGRKRSEWGRDMEVTFARAMNKDKVLKLRDLNAGFTKPDTIALSYYEASLLVDHIVKTYGQPKLNELVRSFADGIDTEAALKRTMNVSIDDLQTTFSAALETQFGTIRRAINDADTPVDTKSVEALRAAAAAKPDSFISQLALGKALADAHDAAAYAPLEKAAALVPSAIGPESPHLLMAKLAEALGDPARAMKEYEALLAVDHTNVEAARTLAAIADKAGDPRLTVLALDRVVSLDPFDASAHSQRGNIALKQRDADIAMREFRAALQAGAPDKAAAHCDLGESYLLGNRPADAKKEALAALEIAPGFERAQELLLNSVERKS